jgi:hypothetical protein
MFVEFEGLPPAGGTTNIRNGTSKHWTRWLGAESRCVVPFNSFSEFNEADGGGIWFALEETRPLACFAGVWTNWTSVRKVKEGDHQRPLRVSDDGAQRRGRRHPPEGYACDPDDAGRSRNLDDRCSG